MGSFTFSAGHPYPDGTVVSAYEDAGQLPPDVPSGVAVSSGTVSGGSLVITGLEAGASYWAFGQIGGAWRRTRIAVPADVPGQGRTVPVGPVCLNSATLSNGTSTGANGKHPFVCASALGTIRLVYPGWYRASSPSVETVNPNALTVQSKIQLPGNVFVDVTFNGGVDRGVVKAGAALISDPVTIDLAANTVAWVRTFTEAKDTDGVAIGSGRWPVYNHGYLTAGEGVHSNGETSKLTQTTSLGSNQVYGPIQILCEDLDPELVLLGCGDSVMAGTGDADGLGWFGRLFNGHVHYQRISQGGETAQSFLNLANSRRRLGLAARCNVNAAIIAHGTNDFGVSSRTGAQVIADIASEAALLRRLLPEVRKVLACTITGQSTSSDSWATTGNQTARTWNSERVIANAAIRAGTIAGIDGYVEIADRCETARDSSIWPAGTTTDGVHPTAAQHAVIAAALNVDRVLAELGG